MKNKTDDLSMNYELNDSLREHNIKILLKVSAGKQFSENCYASLRKGKSKDTPAPPPYPRLFISVSMVEENQG